ncbi:MAG: helix-turn-helix transcriptional regulator [Gaiellaceae bacterium]
MPELPEESLGQRIRRFREERGMSASTLATEAHISKSYLSELETGRGSAGNPSAEKLYRIATALGVAMSDLLGRAVTTTPGDKRPESLVEFARAQSLPESDIEMLASIQFRGEKPKTPERWAFIYQAIRNSASMDRV